MIPATSPKRGSTCSGDGSSTEIFTPVEPLAERVATAFLGVRIECAQCHKHPFDRWTRADYRAFANTVADVQFGLSPEGLAATASLLEDRRKADPAGILPRSPASARCTYRPVHRGASLTLIPTALSRPAPWAGRSWMMAATRASSSSRG